MSPMKSGKGMHYIFGLMVIFGHLVWPYCPEYAALWFLFIRPSRFGLKALPQMFLQQNRERKRKLKLQPITAHYIYFCSFWVFSLLHGKYIRNTKLQNYSFFKLRISGSVE